MSKYIPCMGPAVSGEADMARLGRESARGWHLAGMSPLGLCYRLERGEPRGLEYCSVLGPRPDAETLGLYREGGWEPVVVEGSFHVLRADEGAVPIFTDEETRLEALSEQRKRYGRLSAGCLLAATAIAAVLAILWGLPRTAPLLAAGGLLAVALTASFVLFVGFGMCYLRIRRSMGRRWRPSLLPK